MSDGSNEVYRLERKIDLIASDLSLVRETLAAVVARAESAVTTAAALDIVRRDLHEHEQEDAALQSALKTDVRKLWQGVAAVFVAAMGAFWTALIGGAW